MKKVLLFGTFDGVHEGHRNLFRQARMLGDEVKVVIARDRTVEKVKNRTPNNSEDLRLQEVQSQPDVTSAQLGVLEGDKYAVIGAYKPDIILLGYDQEVFTEKIAEVVVGYGLQTEIIRAISYEPDKYKSSKLNIILS